MIAVHNVFGSAIAAILKTGARLSFAASETMARLLEETMSIAMEYQGGVIMINGTGANKQFFSASSYNCEAVDGLLSPWTLKIDCNDPQGSQITDRKIEVTGTSTEVNDAFEALRELFIASTCNATADVTKWNVSTVFGQPHLSFPKT